jgi:hypothetical protein
MLLLLVVLTVCLALFETIRKMGSSCGWFDDKSNIEKPMASSHEKTIENKGEKK